MSQQNMLKRRSISFDDEYENFSKKKKLPPKKESPDIPEFDLLGDSVLKNLGKVEKLCRSDIRILGELVFKHVINSQDGQETAFDSCMLSIETRYTRDEIKSLSIFIDKYGYEAMKEVLTEIPFSLKVSDIENKRSQISDYLQAYKKCITDKDFLAGNTNDINNLCENICDTDL